MIILNPTLIFVGASLLVLWRIWAATLQEINCWTREDTTTAPTADLRCDYCRQDDIQEGRCQCCGAPVTEEWKERRVLSMIPGLLNQMTYM